MHGPKLPSLIRSLADFCAARAHGAAAFHRATRDPEQPAFVPSAQAGLSRNSYHQAPLQQILFRPISPEQVNQRNVLIDAIGVGITAGVGSFLAVFLVRLGASNFLVGLLTAMPSLTGMVLAIPVGEFLARRRNIVPWFAGARFLVLSCYVLTGLVPFLVHDHRPEAIILIWAAATLPQTVVSVAFTVVMGRVGGPGGRLTLISWRWSTLGLTNALTVALVGQVLKLYEFPLNYQVVFIGSAIGAVISLVFSSSIRLPPSQEPLSQESLWQGLRQHGRSLRANRPFVRFAISQLVYRWGLALAAPLFPIYWVRNVGASDTAISAINGVQTIITMVAYFLWTRASQQRGVRWVLLVTTMGLSFYPLLTALTHRVELLVIWAGMAGLFAAGVDLVFFDVALRTCPAEQQPAYIGIYQTTVYIATFLGPLVGSTLADTFGIVPALIVGSALRLAGFGLMAGLGVGQAH